MGYTFKTKMFERVILLLAILKLGQKHLRAQLFCVNGQFSQEFSLGEPLNRM